MKMYISKEDYDTFKEYDGRAARLQIYFIPDEMVESVQSLFGVEKEIIPIDVEIDEEEPVSPHCEGPQDYESGESIISEPVDLTCLTKGCGGKKTMFSPFCLDCKGRRLPPVTIGRDKKLGKPIRHIVEGGK